MIMGLCLNQKDEKTRQLKNSKLARIPLPPPNRNHVTESFHLFLIALFVRLIM